MRESLISQISKRPCNSTRFFKLKPKLWVSQLDSRWLLNNRFSKDKCNQQLSFQHRLRFSKFHKSSLRRELLSKGKFTWQALRKSTNSNRDNQLKLLHNQCRLLSSHKWSLRFSKPLKFTRHRCSHRLRFNQGSFLKRQLKPRRQSIRSVTIVMIQSLKGMLSRADHHRL